MCVCVHGVCVCVGGGGGVVLTDCMNVCVVQGHQLKHVLHQVSLSRVDTELVLQVGEWVGGLV